MAFLDKNHSLIKSQKEVRVKFLSHLSNSSSKKKNLKNAYIEITFHYANILAQISCGGLWNRTNKVKDDFWISPQDCGMTQIWSFT